MSTATIETVTKMLERLPEPVQDRAIEHLREYLEEVTDEMLWDEKFSATSEKLSSVAQSVRQQIAEPK